MQKSQQVRNMIAATKAKNGAPADLIADVMKEFGFPRQLARRYINNNWDKDTVLTRASTKKVVAAVNAAPKMTFEEALQKVAKRNDKGHFIKREIREEMARELIA